MLNCLRNNLVFLRFTLYTLLVFGICGMLPVIVAHGDALIFVESGPIEWLQLALLVGSALLFAHCAWRWQRDKDLALLLAILCALAAVRELDSFFDRLFPVGGWYLPATVLLACLVWSCWRANQLLDRLRSLSATHLFTLLWCGFIVAVPFAQLIGHGNFLSALMGDDYNRTYKRVIEELGELLGYILLLIGSIEAEMAARMELDEQTGNSAQ